MSFSWEAVLRESGIPQSEADAVAQRLEDEGYEEKDIPLIDRSAIEHLGVPLKGVFITRILAGLQKASGKPANGSGPPTPSARGSLTRSESPSRRVGEIEYRNVVVPGTPSNAAAAAAAAANGPANNAPNGIRTGANSRSSADFAGTAPNGATAGAGAGASSNTGAGAVSAGVVTARKAILQRGLGAPGAGAGPTANGGAPYGSPPTLSTVRDNDETPDSLSPVMPSSMLPGRSAPPALNTALTISSNGGVIPLSPSGGAPSASSAPGASSMVSPASQERVLFPNGRWKEVKDATTGRNYYYHTITRGTTWFKPDDFIPSPRNDSPNLPVSSSTGAPSSSASGSSTDLLQGMNHLSMHSSTANANGMMVGAPLSSAMPSTRPPSSSIVSNYSALSSASSTPRLANAHSLSSNANYLSTSAGLGGGSYLSSPPAPANNPLTAVSGGKRHSTHLSISSLGNAFDLPGGLDSKFEEEPGMAYPSGSSPYTQPGSVLTTPVSRHSSFHYQAASAFGFMPTFSQPSDGSQQSPTSPTMQMLQYQMQAQQAQSAQNHASNSSQPASHTRRASSMFDLHEFARTRFNAGPSHHSRSGSKLTDALAFSKTLDTPLCKDLTGAAATEALQAFRNITGYMGDRSSSKPSSGHIIKLLAHGLRGNNVLRDEMYCQLCKQTTGNPTQSSNLRGWELMSLSCGVFAPSNDLMPFLMGYLESTVKREESKYSSQDKAVLNHAKYCVEILPRTVANGPRKWVPCELEVEAVKKSAPVSIRVSLQDGSWRTMSFDSQTTVRDVTLLLYKKMNWTNFPLFKEQHCFGLFQVVQEDPEIGNAIPLSENDKMLDVIASWYDNTPCIVRAPSQKSMDFELDELSQTITIDKHTNTSILNSKGKRQSLLSTNEAPGAGGGGAGGDDDFDASRTLRMSKQGGSKAPRRFSVAPKHLKYRLEFAPKIFVAKLLAEESALAPEAQRLYYYRAVTDVIQGVYNWNEADAVRLAALQMQAEYEQGQPPSSLEQDIHRFFPYHMLLKVGYDFKKGADPKAKEKSGKGKKRDDPAATLMQRALLLREQLKGLTALAARRSYMDTVRKQPLYGCAFFRVTQFVAANVSDWSEKLQQKGKAEAAIKTLVGSSKNTVKQPLEYVLAISENTLFYIEPTTVQIKGQKPLMSITKYEWTESTFAYTIGSRASVVEIEKIYVFKTPDGEQICEFLSLYK